MRVETVEVWRRLSRIRRRDELRAALQREFYRRGWPRPAQRYAQQKGPQEGETKWENGRQYVLRGGRWHRVWAGKEEAHRQDTRIQHLTEGRTLEAGVGRFREVRARVPEKAKPFLTDYTSEELQEITAAAGALRVMEDGTAAYILTADGDLRNVFRTVDGRQGIGARAVIEAISRGARTLDCLGDGLGFYYARFGFVATKAVLWDDAQAPANWDYEQNDRPNVFFMEYRGESREPQEIERRAREGDYPPFEHPGFGPEELCRRGWRLIYGNSPMKEPSRAAPFTAEELRRAGYPPEGLDLDWLNKEWQAYQVSLIRTYGPEEGQKRAMSQPERNNFLAASWTFG